VGRIKGIKIEAMDKIMTASSPIWRGRENAPSKSTTSTATIADIRTNRIANAIALMSSPGAARSCSGSETPIGASASDGHLGPIADRWNERR
jgi:hypothetical protein